MLNPDAKLFCCKGKQAHDSRSFNRFGGFSLMARTKAAFLSGLYFPRHGDEFFQHLRISEINLPYIFFAEKTIHDFRTECP